MSFDSLCQQINELTDKVESLLIEEDEADCASLLNKRQTLLEKLKQGVDDIQEPNKSAIQQAKLRVFLLAIQARDNRSIVSVKAKAQQLLGQGALQAKGNKAIKAYRSAL